MVSALKQYLNIGSNLRKFRESYKENQTEFAKRLGISRSTYSNYENNNRLPDDETLINIADVLGIKVNELLGVEVVAESSDYEALEEIVKKFGEDNDEVGLEFGESISKKLKELSDAGLEILKNSPIGIFEDYLRIQFIDKYADLLENLTTDQKQEIYLKTKEYIDLLLKLKEKENELRIKEVD